MSKLKLDVDGLAVESFEVSRDAGFLGTVRARDSFIETVEIAVPSDAVETVDGCGDLTITPPPTSWKTCGVICQDTRYISCVTACSCRTVPGCTTCT